jgi:hypothetical protein
MGKEGVAAEMDDILNVHLEMAEEHNEDVGMEFEDEDATELEDTGEPAIVEEELEPADDLTAEGEPAGEVVIEDGEGEPEPAEILAGDTPPEKPAIKFDEQNNIVDANGEVIAKAGAERRLFQKLQTAEKTIEDTARANEGFRNFASAPQKMGLTPNEAIQGMQFISDLKTKPVEAARAILQEAMKQGYNLHDIIGTQEGVEDSSMDMGAINRMIDSKLAPMTQQFTQQQEVQQERQRAQEVVNQFVNAHDYADVHLDTIKHLMQNNPNLSSERAYFEVKTYAMQQGLDFSQPLAPQIEAMQQQVPTPAPVPAVAPEPNPKPLPNGNANSIVMEQSEVTSGDDDWDSIVRSSMRDAGYN